MRKCVRGEEMEAERASIYRLHGAGVGGLLENERTIRGLDRKTLVFSF